MTDDDSNITGSDFLADLSWQIAMGADECIGNAPINRYEKVETDKAKRLAAHKALQDTASSAPKANDATTPMRAAVSRNAPLGAAEAIVESKKIAGASTSLAELEEAILGFDGCALKQTAGNTVIGDGLGDGDIMFIGEAPGDADDKEGKPFMGASGQMLDVMLSFIGINRENAYFTNALYWRPPGKRTPTDGEIATCLPLLRRQIELVNPKVVVLLGNIPANMLLENTTSIKRLRGKWVGLNLDGLEGEISALPMFHPTFLLKNSEQKRLAWADMLSLRAKLEELELNLN